MSDRPEDDLVTIHEAGRRLGISERTMWTLLRQSSVVRYRVPGHGKTTFLRWPEVEQAYRSPRAIGPLGDEGEPKKLVA